MNQGDLPSFQNVMTMGFEGLKKSTASLKHMIVFSDGNTNLDQIVMFVVDATKPFSSPAKLP